MVLNVNPPRRLAWMAPLLALSIGCSMAFAPGPVATAQDAPALVVDDAATANPDLVDVQVSDPAGVGISGQTLQVPEGYGVSVIAQLSEPRFMAIDAAGSLLVSDAGDGVIYHYPFDGVAFGDQETLLSGLSRPASVALFTTDDGPYLYVGEPNQVTRYQYDTAGAAGEPEIVIPDLPTGGHSTRTVTFGPDGMLYLAVGSSCNICVEEDAIRATVSRASPDGSDLQIIATGLRNPVGLAFQPDTETLWATVNERDQQGNEIPPDLVTIVTEGANYGWPACMPPDAAPQESGADCSGITPPTVGIQAHSAARVDLSRRRRRTRRPGWRSDRRSAWLLESPAAGRAEAAADRF